MDGEEEEIADSLSESTSHVEVRESLVTGRVGSVFLSL